MMGLYQYKDFLTIDDLAYYLQDKGILPKSPIKDIDIDYLQDFIIELFQSDKLTPVFDYDGYIIAIEKSIYDYEIDTYKGKMRASNAMLQNWKKSKAITYKPFKGQFDPFQDAFVNERYKKYIDDGKKIILYADNRDDDVTEVEFLYPREQLLAIFEQTTDNNEQQQITDLQAENARLQARIAELESQTNIATMPYFDNTNIYTYPPELDVAIKIWHEIYQTNNISKYLTSHNERFIQACKNLGFTFKENLLKERIQKVTTPQQQKEKSQKKK